MARIQHSLAPLDGLRLINSMLDGNATQEKLVAWKRKYSHCIKSIGEVGRCYWKGFIDRNSHLIVSAKGQKYELSRANWTTYQNFAQMCLSISHEMVSAKVAVNLPYPVRMDAKGNLVDEGDTYGYKVTHDIVKPEMCVVASEVSGNTSQKDDGLVGCELLFTERGSIAQRKISTKNKLYTLLGLTLLSGDPRMCVLIMAGDRLRTEVETGIDMFAKTIGNINEDDYFLKNSKKGKRFPGSPTCVVKGIEVPRLVRWSPKRSMTSEILVDICATIDYCDVFDRSDGAMSFFLLDGHGSRVELPFLEYVNNPEYLGCACIVVPYGTDLWQVGDSAEQNGTSNMCSTKEKAEIVRKKEVLSLPPVI